MLRKTFFNSHQSASFPNRSVDCGPIKWPNTAQIYHLSTNSFLCKHLSCL
uniref:Pyruvate dehydrogenase n=1 Tax=Rhizophora mucronata TaxID=61149 RepID=A0A2P2M2W3_RHIMU